MRTWAVRGLLLLLAVLALPVAQAQPAPGLLPLSPLQREYLVAHPTIVVGQYDSGWPPFESLRDGQQVGLGDLDDDRLSRAIDIVAEGYQLQTTPEAGQVFDRSFLPPLDDRQLVLAD